LVARFSTSRPSHEEAEGASFLDSVNTYFDRAAAHVKAPRGVLENIKACNSVYMIKFPIKITQKVNFLFLLFYFLLPPSPKIPRFPSFLSERRGRKKKKLGKHLSRFVRFCGYVHFSPMVFFFLAGRKF
jgi:hypothetical protein